MHVVSESWPTKHQHAPQIAQNGCGVSVANSKDRPQVEAGTWKCCALAPGLIRYSGVQHAAARDSYKKLHLQLYRTCVLESVASRESNCTTVQRTVLRSVVQLYTNYTAIDHI